MRARRRTQKDGWGLEGALERKRGLKGALDRKRGLKVVLERKRGLKDALKREVGLGNALPWMVKCLKAHLKGDEGSKAP